MDMNLGLRMVSKNKTLLLLAPLLCSTIQATYAQTKTPTPTKTVMLVDTDDACRLTVDDQDEGVITPDQSKKLNVGLGDHIVKCVVESIPDLTWRKVVTAKSSEQAAVIIALKALHMQYDQAARQAEQQKQQATAAKEQAAAAEEKRKTDEAEFPARLFEAMKGVWSRNTHDDNADWRSRGEMEPHPSDEEEILNIQTLDNRTITAQLTWNRGLSDGTIRHRTIYSLSFHIPDSLPTEVRCIESGNTYSRDPRKTSKGPCGSSEPMQRDLKIKLLDSNHLQLIPGFLQTSNAPEVFTK